MLGFLGTTRLKLLRSTAEPGTGGFSPWGSMCPPCPLVLASPLGFCGARKEEGGDTRWTGRTRCPFTPRQHGVTQTGSGAKVHALLPAWLPAPASSALGGQGVSPRVEAALSVSRHPGCRRIAGGGWAGEAERGGCGSAPAAASPFPSCVVYRGGRSGAGSRPEARPRGQSGRQDLASNPCCFLLRWEQGWHGGSTVTPGPVLPAEGREKGKELGEPWGRSSSEGNSRCADEGEECGAGARQDSFETEL